ncbi:hypothetical protein [Bacillus fonticola]|uniref:hypothetical protein n=1 Tax=Bacillus fonticola TaxID=2728853 RepID=UPI0014740B04|nr:hypothetical protein [Bacillus fonticola]
MQLQKFVSEVIEGLGGVVVPVEYALCQVLIPEDYQGFFQGKSELDLAFDFEVAQENPQSEFVTFGSYILEQVLTIANLKAVSGVRFSELDRVILANPLKKIADFLSEDLKKVTLLNENQVMGIWVAFEFGIAIISDEKDERMEQLWVNLMTGEVSEAMKHEQNRIIYTDKPVYHYPIPKDVNIEEAYRTAYCHVETSVKAEQKELLQNERLQKDMNRIETYYDELLNENEKKTNRKGLSKEKISEIKDKSKVINLEKNKQLQEIQDKYQGKIEITLNHGIMYFIPMIQYHIDIRSRSESKTQTLYYNLITKNFERGE